MGVTNQQLRRKKSRPPATRAAVLLGSQKGRRPQGMGGAGDLPSREALTARLESQRLELLRAMACVHVARRTIEEHGAEPRHGDVLPLKAEQHEGYRQRVLEALSVAGDALATAYPMLERIAEALDAEEMLKAHAVGRSQPPPARRSASS